MKPVGLRTSVKATDCKPYVDMGDYTPKMEAEGSCDTSVTFYQTTWCHISEDLSLCLIKHLAFLA
jgi:hypothetical protein